MKKKELYIPFNAPVCNLDREDQTYGCRAKNPYACSSNNLPNICAFASEDHICRKPTRAWKQQYLKLSGQE